MKEKKRPDMDKARKERTDLDMLGTVARDKDGNVIFDGRKAAGIEPRVEEIKP